MPVENGDGRLHHDPLSWDGRPCEWRGCQDPAYRVFEVSCRPPGFTRNVDVMVALCTDHHAEMHTTHVLSIDWSLVLLAQGEQGIVI